MVSKKSIHNGQFDGFQTPVVPKAPRSLRISSTKTSEGSKICAFDLLAAVADQLLQESESCTSSIGPERKEQISIPKDIVKREEPEVKLKHARSEHFDQGSCVESESVPESTNLKGKLEPVFKESPQSDIDSGLEHVSDVNNVKLEPFEGKNVDKLEGNDPSHGDLCDFNLVNSIDEIQMEAVEKQSGDLTYSEPVESRVNTRVLNKPYSRAHIPFYKDRVPCFTRDMENVKIGITDNDKSYSRCNRRGTKTRGFRSQSRVGYRRIRKMMTSRYRKVTPKKDYELTNITIGGTKPFYQNRRNIRCQTEAASKRRKLYHHSSNPAYIHEASRESISESYDKSGYGDKTRPFSTSNKVKFSIKSFKVPELYIEIPETATVGSLKRTVMEAVTAILGGELHVEILLEGKKIKDNNRTLQQTGISQSCDLDTLGFTLEPSFLEASTSPIQKEPPLMLPHDTNQEPSRFAASPVTDVGFSNSFVDSPQATSLDNHADKNQEIRSLQTEELTEERVADSKALVPLSVIPVTHKPTEKSEVSQRRIRRPFSVSEVEALVEAVETIGTGRWRDVKLRAFDDENHRTYVDLKDKWKTLVHTATISPQQRRGQPVPQDLLDRVLAAQAYWSQHQIRQQRVHQNEPLRIVDGSSAEFIGI